MESLSRPLNRRKLSNVNSFSGKNSYDGVFSGHRPKYNGAPAVKVEEYREIFCSNQAGSSIPVLDLSGFEESSDGLESTKPDYGMIFGGFRDQDIAISYEALVARDKARVPSSMSPSSQDLDDPSHQSSDALKQVNMSYNKISQRNKDGLDVTTHVTQLHDVPGFTCFIDESASQPNNETVKQKSSSTNNINMKSSNPDVLENQTLQSSVEFDRHQDINFKTFEADIKSHPSKVLSSSESPATNNVPVSPPADSQPKKETEKVDFPEEKTSQIAVESQNRYGQDEHFSDDRNVKTLDADLKSYSSNVSSSHVASATNLDKHKDYQKRLNGESFSDDRNFEMFEADFKSNSSKVSSSPAASATNLDNHKDHQKRSTATNEVAPSTSTNECEAKSDDTNLKTFEADFKSYSSKISSSPAASATNLDKNKDYQKRSNAESFSGDSNFKTFEADFKSYSSKVSTSHAAYATNLDNLNDHQKRSTTRNEELDVNSAAAALRKAIEKAQESIRIAKESVGRKTEGFKGFSSRSFKNSLKVKARVANVDANEEQKEKVDNMKERDHKNVSTVTFPDFVDGEKLFGDKKVVNETHGKISELLTNSEIPIRSPFVMNDNKMVCNSKEVVDRIEAESIDSNIFEDTQKDNERPNGFLVLESCEKKLEDTDLTVCQKVETEKKLSQTSDDQDGYVKKFSEESFELLENNMQENLEQEHDEEVVKDYGGTGSHTEEEKFYDVSEAESIKNAQTYACKIETKDSSRKEEYEYHKADESYENSSSDYDDAEENENVIGASNVVDDTEEACKIDQNDNNAESSQEIDDVSASHLLEVEYKEAVEKEIFENISSDETEDNTDECEAKSANLETCGFADVDFGQNDVQFESSLDAIHGMEIEVKEYQERQETVEEEETNLQQPHEETPEVRIEMDTGTPQEPKDECRESEPIEVVDDKEERERERIKLAVERAIREARERAFAEVRQRVLADTREKVTKASIDKTSAQFKLRAERALVERATAEARQRALEKAMKISEPNTQVNETKQTSSTSQTNTESALRSKAKLEKHNRIMERAAKALAEKEKRDLFALREQAERSRLAEYLDADIKRWSTGKEGNLRALLSTLQYILGADSGWQPVSLTEIITTSAVKKAYRKATLCVHPDKVQQRGASIQQKYICEKVFDLLKAAWNRFNSEER